MADLRFLCPSSFCTVFRSIPAEAISHSRTVTDQFLIVFLQDVVEEPFAGAVARSSFRTESRPLLHFSQGGDACLELEFHPGREGRRFILASLHP
jgi:hypothetical protein